MAIRLGIFVTHPVQYHTPIWRLLAQSPELEVKVHFFSDHSIRGGIDPGFGVPVAWDTPLLEGYESTFLSRDADIRRPRTFVMKQPEKILREGKFDWIFIAGYTHPFELQLLRIARSMGIKVLMRGEFTDLKTHTPPLWKRLVRRWFLRWVYHRVDAFGCVGYQAKQHLLAHGVPESAMFFSPYSVHSAMFEQQKQQFDRNTTRKTLGLQDNIFTFLYSGKLIPRKQVHVVVEAMAHLQHPERAALLILGDGEQRDAVIARGREILGERLLFQGFVNQSALGQYFLASDAFVLASDYEAWGLVANEAMLFSLPLILSDKIGCHMDLLQPGETGYLFRTGDARDLARCMDLLMADPSKARNMGKNAYQRVQAYSTEASAQGLLDAILSSRGK